MLTQASAQELIFPYQYQWNVLSEGDLLEFKLSAQDSIQPSYYRLEGGESLGIQFDSIGNFYWKPSFDLVDRLEKEKEFNVIFEAMWNDEKKSRAKIDFKVLHKNRPPLVEELPVVYVKMNSSNSYQIPDTYVRDPDGDPLSFRVIPEQLPQGANLSSNGLFTWTPSRGQFYALKEKPLTLDFVVEDLPEKLASQGKLRIAQTQMDLPPEILIVPGDTLFRIRENEIISLKLYVSDANGDDNISRVGMVSSDPDIPENFLKENTKVQYEFIWNPGYDFIHEAKGVREINFIFFAIDRTNNRVERKLKVQVEDAENLEEKDKLLYARYFGSLAQAKGLIDVLDENYEVLATAYKKAKKGKKNRALVNASLGATTGLSPIILPTEQAKVVSAVGGTTVLTLGTLEATELVGKSKSDILEKMKVNVEIRNQLQTAGDAFARKYALKANRRNQEFDTDRDKLLPIINNQKLVILELDASKPLNLDFTNKELKKTFPDFSED